MSESEGEGESEKGEGRANPDWRRYGATALLLLTAVAATIAIHPDLFLLLGKSAVAVLQVLLFWEGARVLGERFSGSCVRGGFAARSIRWYEETLVGYAFLVFFGFLLAWGRCFRSAFGLLPLFLGLVSFFVRLRRRRLDVRAVVLKSIQTLTPLTRLILGLFLAIVILFSIVPIVFFDCWTYHLAIPEWLSLKHSLPRDPHYIFGYYAVGSEVLSGYLFSLLFPETTIVVMNASFFVAVGVLLCRYLAEKDRALLAQLYFSTPAILMLSIIPKGYGLHTFASLGALLPLCYRLEGIEEGGKIGRLRGALPLGAALGLALSTHFIGILIVLCFSLLAFFRLEKGRFFFALSVGLLLASPVYLRNFLETGNPVFPYLSAIFPGSMRLPKAMLGPGTHNVFVLLRKAIRIFTDVEPAGVGSTLGLWIPLGLFLGWWESRKCSSRRFFLSGIWLLFGVLFLVGYFRYARFLLPGLLLPTLPAVYGWRRHRQVVAILAVLQMVIGVGLSVFGPFSPADFLLHRDSFGYRLRFVPTEALAEYAVERLPEKTMVASLGILRSYRWKGRLELSSILSPPRIAEFLKRSNDADQLADILGSNGYSYLAVDFTEWRRLRRQYRYCDFPPLQEKILEDLLERSEIVAAGPGCKLYRITSARSVP
ncbi:MAG: hypothetical protein D6679_13045 [Candidatus Hydrogenedentota bacterium]|nr:MAG: hypothetical protein D6679_13045 [Candidatus Hydrogenedentota bacterium]